MGLKDDKRKLIHRRGEVTEAIREKIADRADVREKRNRKKERDPNTEAKQRELDKQIRELNAEEDELTRRIKHLRSRKDAIIANLKKVLQAIANANRQPDFNGHPSNVNADVKAVIRKGQSFGLVVTSTTDGGSHASTSWHYPWNNSDGLGGAVDMGGSLSAMQAFQRWAYDNADKFRESIGPLNDQMVKNGVRYSLPEGNALENMHDNHNHLAPYPGAFT